MSHQEKFFYQTEEHTNHIGVWDHWGNGSGSADRYFQEEIINDDKFVPEGVEGRVPYRESVVKIIEQLIGGLKASWVTLVIKLLKILKIKQKL